jgi:SAM-dependent methyltransferase
MWDTWEKKIRDALPNFCTSPLYVAQDIPVERYEEIAPEINKLNIQLGRATLGAEYGATVMETKSLGRVTRMWVDSMFEVNFIAKHLVLDRQDVLDIGAGYGRLAAAMEGLINTYTCTDAIPISRFVCEYFTLKHARLTDVMAPEQLITRGPFNLAINIHSWSECSLKSIEEWLAILRYHNTEHLFTVPHDDDYLSWGDGSFRPLIEREFTLVESVKIGLGNHPHALWKRR